MKPQTSSPTSNVTPIKRNSPGVATIWQITYSCGHQADRDLSDRAADRRAGFAEWLAKQECTDCWRAAKEGDEQDKAAWLEAKRAEEQAESEAWSQQYRMPPLEGTERAVAWGVRCRHQVLAAAYTALVLEGETSETEWGGRSRKPLAPSPVPGGGSTSAPPSLTTSRSCSRQPPKPTGRPRTPTSDRPVPRLVGAPAPLSRNLIPHA